MHALAAYSQCFIWRNMKHVAAAVTAAVNSLEMAYVSATAASQHSDVCVTVYCVVNNQLNGNSSIRKALHAVEILWERCVVHSSQFTQCVHSSTCRTESATSSYCWQAATAASSS
eukprot:12103-Heterococcus_DN1.PRE.2